MAKEIKHLIILLTEDFDPENIKTIDPETGKLLQLKNGKWEENG